jgi:3-deoxy-7-phosphoheptulonate synthase
MIPSSEIRSGTAQPVRRINYHRPLTTPKYLINGLPLDPSAEVATGLARDEVLRIINGEDDRLLVIVGPCSVHDPEATLEYARRLTGPRRDLADDLYIVMRAYFEKPRTTVGWKGLISDPYLDGSNAIEEGLRVARRVLLRIADLGVPVGSEFLDPISAQFLADAVTWASIGARTTESQIHRQFTSGLPIPVGFKNGTNGGAQVAIDACRAAAMPHDYVGIDECGQAAIISTSGNPDCHVILRGGNTRPNYQPNYVASTLAALRRASLAPRLMVDASHGNSGRDHRRQPVVAREIGDQIAAGEMGIVGVMLESFLVEGCQEPAPLESLLYGKSITDACMDFGQTATVLIGLAEAVRKRRAGIGRL